MNDLIKKGELKRWNDDKGFGFIDSGNAQKDIFIHISALKKMGRRPTIGDVIIYEVHTDTDGKKRAVNAKIEGVLEHQPRTVRRINKHTKSTNWVPRILLLFSVIIIGSIAYNKVNSRNEIKRENNADMASYLTNESENNYSCTGKIYCSEMASCEEAKFYQRNCPGTKMDGDGDGVPCESQWCSW